jgi:FkbH-like protein
MSSISQQAQVMEEALAKCAWQPALFAELPKRHELATLNADWLVQPLRLRVHRNHAFEHLASAAEKWLNWWGKSLELAIGDYDDSLSFGATNDDTADLDLVWLDLARYPVDQVEDWLVDRLGALRALSDRPILVLVISALPEMRERISKISGVYYRDVEDISHPTAFEFISERTARFTGTRLSDAALMLTARELACRWIPSALKLNRKAVVVDLDNTIYRGVLGEQGPLGLKLTESHQLLQHSLRELKARGFLLALASRNEERDVRALFEKRTDFPLRWTDFSAHAVSWGDKASGLASIAEKLCIGVDSLVFVDDNPGELAAVVAALPHVGLIHADEDALLTARALDYFPGLWKSRLQREDQLRAEDLAANSERARISSSSIEPKDYLRSLRVVLDIYLNQTDQLERMVELSQKTNQFNLSLSRLSEVDLTKRLENPASSIVTIRLRDRLCDSGLIGLLALNRQDGEIRVDELTISCRALGRGLEDLIIGKALECAFGKDVSRQSFFFRHSQGPRNQPARSWLARHCGSELAQEGWQKVAWWEEKTCAVSDVVTINFHRS